MFKLVSIIKSYVFFQTLTGSILCLIYGLYVSHSAQFISEAQSFHLIAFHYIIKTTILTVTAMTASKWLNKSLYIFSALLLAACQPSPPTDEPVTAENSETVENPLIISGDSVTMTSDHILSIKPSRYQPSMGLQGTVESIKQTKLIAAHPVSIEDMLISEGQWVEKGTPLFIVKRLGTADETTIVSNSATMADVASGNSDMATKEEETRLTAADKSAIKEQVDADSKHSVAVKEVKGKPLTADADSNNKETDSNDRNKSEPQYNLTTVHASFSGRVEHLYAAPGQKLAARSPILQLSDETQLYFIATVPMQAESQLSVGQTVNFTTENIADKFTGQVSKLTVTSEPKKLLVYVNVIDNEMSREKLHPDMKVTGRVDYGQIDVGTIVPKRALHDVDLSELQTPPYKPLRPLQANVWIIGQNQRLTRQPVEVVEYNPSTKQYLIADISNDSLICLANLPVDSKGKKVIVS